MCYTLEISLECFCDSRVIEVITYSKTNTKNPSDGANRMHPYCFCNTVKLQSFQFQLCHVCMKKILIIRRKVKNILLSIFKNETDEFFYHDSVSTFVQKKIKFEPYQSFHWKGGVNRI